MSAFESATAAWELLGGGSLKIPLGSCSWKGSSREWVTVGATVWILGWLCSCDSQGVVEIVLGRFRTMDWISSIASLFFLLSWCNWGVVEGASATPACAVWAGRQRCS